MLNINFYILLIISGLFLVSSCSKDYTNPNQPTYQETFTDERAATAVATGLQQTYSTTAAGSLYALVNANGFVTNELILRNAGNIPELQLFTGGNAVDATNTVLLNVWSRSNKIIYEADSVINYARRLQDPTYASGLISFVSIYKALSIGHLSMFWTDIPDTTGANVNFIDRIEGFNKAVAVIDNAIAWYTSNPTNSVVLSRLPTEVDIPNTLYALRARYSLYAGNYQEALTAAGMVDLSKKSVLNYNSLALNPVFESATATNNVFQPVDSTLGLPVELAPDLNDQRIPYYIGINPTIAPRYRIKGFYASGSTQVPIYMPGEIMLIKAEAYARQDMLPEALTELNNVITKQPANDIYGVGAGLTGFGGTTKEEILTEIYRQRCIELFMSGLKLEDMRRFERPLSERKRNFFPYPFAERDNNPNTPDDPEF